MFFAADDTTEFVTAEFVETGAIVRDNVFPLTYTITAVTTTGEMTKLELDVVEKDEQQQNDYNAITSITVYRKCLIPIQK